MSDFSLYAKNKGSLHLQRFSRFLLDHHLRDFVKQQLILSREVEVPLLKYLKHFTEEQLIEISMVSLTEYLQYLSEDKGEELMEISLKKWEADELGLIGKFELLAEDISLINYVRSRTFRKFIPLFTNEATIALELIDELESFFVTSTITATNTYIRILKDQIAKNEKKLLEAQEIAHLGNFEWDLATNKSKNSPQIYSIFEVEEGITADSFMAYIHPEDKERVEDNLQKALVSGGYEHEYRFTKDGKTKYIFSTGKVLYNNEKPYKVIGTIQDVTGLKQIENRLLEKTIALEKSNESLEQFAHVASHDLNEPLRKISVLTDVIIKRENSLSESSRITLKKIHSASV
ncbi:MAG TPA: PAS domain-containing protein, partial [Segetibacter sp.]